MNKSMVLLTTLLKSTSQLNICRYCKDNKKKGKVIGNLTGVAVLYLMLMAYCAGTCIGYGKIGLTGIIPGICALTISAMAFILTFFKTNGYLFGFKEYDMLMSLPFEAKTVAGCKFLYMYIKSLPWNISIALAMLIGYAVYARPAVYVYIIWPVLSLFLPVIPMLGAAFIGFIIAKVSAGFKKNNIIQTVLVFLLVVGLMIFEFGIGTVAENGQMEEVLTSAADKLKEAENIYLPASWFDAAVTEGSITGMFLLAGISVILFEIVFILVGRSYRKINSLLKTHASSAKSGMNTGKRKGVLNAIAFKEFKRMTGSTTYMTNAGIGMLFALLMGLAVFFVDIDKMIGIILKGAPVTKEMLFPAIPLIVYFMLGMVATTAITPSLEGKNYWIVQSLPIARNTLWKGKMLYNMYLTVPFMTFAVICICISAKVPLLTSVLSLILGFALCALSTCWGCVCGVKHMRLDWENEIEVVKQGAAVGIYLLFNMPGTMGLTFAAVFLGTKADHNLVLAGLILIVSILAAICYRKVMKLR